MPFPLGPLTLLYLSACRRGPRIAPTELEMLTSLPEYKDVRDKQVDERMETVVVSRGEGLEQRGYQEQWGELARWRFWSSRA